MKKLASIFALIILVSSFAFAEDGRYGVTEGYSDQSTVTATGNVLAVPIVITPETETIALGDIVPGQSAPDLATTGAISGGITTYTNVVKKVSFDLNKAVGYNFIVTVTPSTGDELDDKTSVKWVYGDGTTFYGRSDNSAFDAYVNAPFGKYTGWVGIAEFKAEGGAKVGGRTFTLTINVEYAEANLGADYTF